MYFQNLINNTPQQSTLSFYDHHANKNIHPDYEKRRSQYQQSPTAYFTPQQSYQNQYEKQNYHDGYQENFNKWTNKNDQKRYDQQNKEQNFNQQTNPCDDSFLNMVDEHLNNAQTQRNNNAKIQQQINQLKLLKNSQQNKSSTARKSHLTISKTQISHCLLQNQLTQDSIQLTNLYPCLIIVKLLNSPFQFRLTNTKNKFIKKDLVEIQLQPYQSIQIEFQIKKRQGEIGNIYETLTVEVFNPSTDENNQQESNYYQGGSELISKIFLKFQITFIKPKLEISFLGKTKVKRIQEHKIASLEIYPNQINEYSMNLIFTQDQFGGLMKTSKLNTKKLQKIQCSLETKGYISVYPNNIVLFQGEQIKLVIRKLSEQKFLMTKGINSDKQPSSAIVIKPIGSSLVYVIAVKCIDGEDSEGNKQSLNKIRL